MAIKALRGMNDIFSPEIHVWQLVEDHARKLFALYGYEEVRTPVLEELNLFVRSIGETTSIVEKEMYSFVDRKGKALALRPEGTASIVRAYIQNERAQSDPVARYYNIGPMYRYERPQQGRYRQFHQIGAEVFGIANPRIDAEMIHMVDQFFQGLGIDDLEIELNSLGCPICRPGFTKKFSEYLDSHQSSLCEDCHRRTQKNPLRALDCKQETCMTLMKEAPSIQDDLCDECEGHFDTVLTHLGHLGSSFSVNHKIVRGLDYYLRTTFEFTTSQLGTQNAVAGGGRYDGLVRLLGGPNVPGIGFAVGMERLIELILLKQKITPSVLAPTVYGIAMGDAAHELMIQAAQSLRRSHIFVEIDYEGQSLKAMMRRADRRQTPWVVIMGDEEVNKGIFILRNMGTKEQKEIPMGEVQQLPQRIKT